MNNLFYNISDGAHCLVFLKKETDCETDGLISPNESLGELRNIFRMIFIIRSGVKIFYTRVQNPDTCMAAINKCQDALKYVKNKTPEMCMTAVIQNGFALQHIEQQTEEICLAALNNNPFSLSYVKKLTYELCLIAARKNVSTLKLIKNKNN